MSSWTARAPSEFRSLVAEVVASDRWIVDGNYSHVRDLIWSRATGIVWLNYSFGLIFARALRRTIRRAVHQEELFSGNRESFRGAFLSRDSILWWVISTYRRRRRQYRELLQARDLPHLVVHEFTRPNDAEAFLSSLGQLNNSLDPTLGAGAGSGGSPGPGADRG
jgi:adenylate kinase family enzyme